LQFLLSIVVVIIVIIIIIIIMIISILKNIIEKNKYVLLILKKIFTSHYL